MSSARSGAKDSKEPAALHSLRNAEEKDTIMENTDRPTGNVSPSEPPDGGVTAWLQVAICFCVWVNTFGVLFMFGNFQTYYQTVLFQDHTASQISWIGTIQSSSLFFGSLWAGPFYDLGYTRGLMIVGGFLEALGMFMTSLVKEYWQAMLAQGLCVGLGVGCMLMPSLALLGTYFKQKMPLAITLAASGAAIGGIIYPLMFINLIDSTSFGWTVRAIAFVILGIQMFIIAGVQQRFKPPTVRKIFILSPWTKEPQWSFFAAACFLTYAGVMIPFFYIQQYAVEKCGIKSDFYLYILVVMNAVGLPGRPAFGLLGQRIGALNAFTISAFSSTVLLFAWVGIKSKAGLIIWSLLYGFISSGILSLPFAVLATVLVPDLKELPVRTVMGTAVCGLGFLVGTPIAGAILKHGWVDLQVFGGVVLAAGTLCSCISRAFTVGMNVRKKC